jgi:hypothetical protein
MNRMKKRKWVYIQKPVTYDISCNKCQGINIAWSEFERMIWCYDCELDVPGNGGIFNGPVPILCFMQSFHDLFPDGLEILGFSLDRIYFGEKPVMWKKPRIRDNRVIYWPFACLLD